MRFSNKVAIIVITMTEAILYGALLAKNYIVLTDYSTMPYFAKFSALQSLEGTSYIVNNIYSVVLDPGITISMVISTAITGTYGIKLVTFFYLLLFSYGSFYLYRQFGSVRMSLLGSLITIVNPGVFNVIYDNPFALYISFLPLFLFLYYKFRNEEKRIKYFLLSAIPLTITTPYGPTIPLIFATLLGMELSFVLKRGVKESTKSFLYITLVGAFFILFHLNAVLYSSQIISSYSPLITHSLPKFSIYSIITFNSVRSYEQVFYHLLPRNLYNVYITLIILLFLLIIIESLREKKFMIIFYFLIFLGLMSYGANYLGFYTLFSHFVPIFNSVDPFEYSPIIGLWLGLGISGLNVRKSKKKYSVEKTIRKTIVIATIFMIIIGGIVFVQFDWNAFKGNKIPNSFKEAYSTIENASGVTMFVPSTYAFGSNITSKSFSVLNSDYSVGSTPSSFFYGFPANFLAPPLIFSPNPYNKLYSYLYKGQINEFRNLSVVLDIQYIVYIQNKTLSSWWGSPYISSLSKLIDETGFTAYKNYANSIIILKNPLFKNNYKISVQNGIVEINTNNITKSLITPIPYNSNFKTNAGIKTSSLNGLLVLTSQNGFSKVQILSSIPYYNLITELIILIYLMAMVILFNNEIKSQVLNLQRWFALSIQHLRWEG